MTVLYRYFDGEGQLLYVGIAANPIFRNEQHRGTRWWREVRTVTWEHFDQRDDARRAERQAISTEIPRFNATDQGPIVDVTLDRSGRYTAKDIANYMRVKIRADSWQSGWFLPSTTKLAELFGVAVPTVARAVRQLRHEGLLYRHDRNSTHRVRPTDWPIITVPGPHGARVIHVDGVGVTTAAKLRQAIEAGRDYLLERFQQSGAEVVLVADASLAEVGQGLVEYRQGKGWYVRGDLGG